MDLNSFFSSGDFCHLLITFANSLDPDSVVLKVFFEKAKFEKSLSRRQQYHGKLPSKQGVNCCKIRNFREGFTFTKLRMCEVSQ